jgi:predicted Rossmann fold nucleotide-binding protein DprA/Smf involved in DNA uptake
MSADSVEQFNDGPAWWDHEAGPVVRPYMVTGGRVAPTTADFDLITYVVATTTLTAYTPGPEHQAILALTQEPRAVVEIASRVDLPLGVVRVLLCDLLSEGMISRYDPPPTDHLPNVDTLQAVIHGLRAL